MIKPKHKTLIDQEVIAKIVVCMPILKDLPDAGFPLNLGALTLSLGKRNFILDSVQTMYKHTQTKGEIMEFDVALEIDLDVCKRGSEFNYNLTENDLKNPKLKGEFFCSDDDTPDAFDFDKATIQCTIFVDGVPHLVNIAFE